MSPHPLSGTGQQQRQQLPQHNTRLMNTNKLARQIANAVCSPLCRRDDRSRRAARLRSPRLRGCGAPAVSALPATPGGDGTCGGLRGAPSPPLLLALLGPSCRLRGSSCVTNPTSGSGSVSAMAICQQGTGPQLERLLLPRGAGTQLLRLILPSIDSEAQVWGYAGLAIACTLFSPLSGSERGDARGTARTQRT